MTIAEIDAQYEELRESLSGYLLDGGRLAIVKAPPGSGKTFTLVDVLSRLAAEELRVAVAAQTNSQADDICLRLAMAHPEVALARFSSRAATRPGGLPLTVAWVTKTDRLPRGPGVTVATTAKWALTDVGAPYALLAVDEAWQMGWANLMQCATVSERFLLIGDPGQIPPVVTIDARRWETSPRAPHRAAPEVVLAEPGLAPVRFVGSLPACRRLPHESVDFIKAFYDFDFEAYAAAGENGLDVSGGPPWMDHLAGGRPQVLTIPTPLHGPPIEVDLEAATAVATIVEGLLGAVATVRIGGSERPLTARDLGVTSSHRVMNAALVAALGAGANEVRVDTPERWQGLERPMMIAVHPLSGVTDPSAFDLETGRLCVMASRHQAGMVLLTRDHVGETLRNHVPSAGQAPGLPDAVGRGHNAHLTFWELLEAAGSIHAL
jgi:AAA domain